MYDKAKTGAIRRQKTRGSHVDSQLPYNMGVKIMKKSFLVLGLIFLFSIISFRIYAYSKDLNTMYVSKEQPIVIVNQSMDTQEGKQLVPKGSVLGVNDVEEIIFSYQVFVEDGTSLMLNKQNIAINGLELSPELIELFEFTFTQEKVKEDSLVTHVFEDNKTGFYVTVNVHLSMKQPTKEQYHVIKNGIMTFEVMFIAV